MRARTRNILLFFLGLNWSILRVESVCRSQHTCVMFQDRLGWRDASDLAGACYLVSYSVPPPNVKSSWYVTAAAEDRKVYQRWHRLACYRAAQTGQSVVQCCVGGGGGSTRQGSLHCSVAANSSLGAQIERIWHRKFTI